MSRSVRPGFPVLAGRPLLVAHRGGAALAPENTLEAFTCAAERWAADMIELDVRLSRDGRPVVIHDPTVDRTTEGSGAVSELTLDELRSLDAGYRFRDPDGRRSQRGRGVRIPTLDEVLERLPWTRLTVELKAEGAWPAAVAAIRARGAVHRVVLASSDSRHLPERSEYEGALSAGRKTVLKFWLAARLRLGRRAAFRRSPPPVDIFQVPTRWRGLAVVTPGFIRAAHACNIPVQVWTVNDPDEMRRLLDLGVDGIQSDRPDLLARVLEEAAGRPPPHGD